MTHRHAVALRAFDIASAVPGEQSTQVAKDEVLRGLPIGQFGDFEHAGLVRGATAEDLAGGDHQAVHAEPEKAADAPKEPPKAKAGSPEKAAA